MPEIRERATGSKMLRFWNTGLPEMNNALGLATFKLSIT